MTAAAEVAAEAVTKYGRFSKKVDYPDGTVERHPSRNSIESNND
jgi:hypothetical protein